MAQLNWNADPNNVQEDNDFPVIPPADYPMIMTASEMLDEQGNYKLEWTVDGGEYGGRKIWDWLDLGSEDAEKRARAERKLNAICVACNVIGLTDTEQLHGIPVTNKVTVSEPKPYMKNGQQVMGKAKNWIGAYKPRAAAGGGFGGAPSPAPAPSAGWGGGAASLPAASGASTPPWKRNAA